jgi:hypothetical protein
MIRIILAYFGYAKIPVKVVQLSIMQEEYIKKLIDLRDSEDWKRLFESHLEGQKTLTHFLRSCRLLDRGSKK